MVNENLRHVRRLEGLRQSIDTGAKRKRMVGLHVDELPALKEALDFALEILDPQRKRD